jgi:glycerophosphoryl diester phosphodiesterase
VQIVAHRGGGALGPENSLAAIKASIDAGADWIEIDVQESRDGVVVVVHDSDLAKVAGDPIKIWEATAESLRSVDIGSSFGKAYADQRVPTLDEVLRLCKDRVKVNIELKYYGHDQQLERKVAESVDRFAMASDVVVMSLKLAGARRMKQLRPEWQVGLLTAVALGDLTRLDVDFLAVHQKLATRDLIERAHAREKWVAAWTVNQPAQISELAGRDVDQIITDDPGMAQAVLRWRAELSPLERLAIELAHHLRIQPHALYQREDRRVLHDRSD